MKHIHFREAQAQHFDGGPARGVTGWVAIGRADGADRFCMRVFEIAPGGHTPCHRHPWEHEILIHAGSGEVLRKGVWEPLGAGEVLFIPGGEEHQIRNRSDGPLVFACLIPAGVPEL
jgi:quercetin dioxygenase-like cupin family protein